MDIERLEEVYQQFKYGETLYHQLMRYRIKNILLISTFYTSFSLEEDIKFSEQIIGSYHQFNLTTIPKITTALSGEHAIKILEKQNFDLIISTLQIGKPNPIELSKLVKEKYPETHFVLLLTENCEVDLIEKLKKSDIERIFLWSGNPRIFLSIIKSIEDYVNAKFDTNIGNVPVIILVEDSISYYSTYLPEIYKEIMLQTQRLIKEEADNDLKYLRMRTRPKILLATTREEAFEIYNLYKDFLLCVISDIELGKNDETGIELSLKIREENPDVPILIQSSDTQLLRKAKALNFNICYKNSPFIMSEIKNFLFKNCGFGDFIFRDTKGNEISRAKNIIEFQEQLKNIPIESFKYHADKKHYCMWLLTRGELRLAKKLRKINREKFKTVESHRKFLLNVLKNLFKNKIKGKVLDFNVHLLNENDIILKIGTGSLGGKGRGLAFINALLSKCKLKKKFKGVDLDIPKSFIICTSFFDKFIEENYLYLDFDFHSDEDIINIFLDAKLPEEILIYLDIILNYLNKPIIVRSSGLLEDSQFHPFAGIYESVILPNSSGSFQEKLEHLKNAIKYVYASVYLKKARAYVKNLNLNIEEEKMAIIIQELTGSKHDRYFYPNISGVLQSYNFYPISYMKNEDGIVHLALGLGEYVVEGEKTFKFCPAYPEANYFELDELIKMSQSHFYALDLESNINVRDFHSYIKQLSIDKAKSHGTLSYVASTYDYQNQRLLPGLRGDGPVVIDFANIIKYNLFPLNEILTELLSISKIALGSEVEIEFAVDIQERVKFNVLQVRPMTSYEEVNIEKIDILDKDKMIIFSNYGIGHGTVKNLYSIVYVDPDNFDNSKTLEIKNEISEINKNFVQNDERYILIGIGRWGTRDRFLGIPVDWNDINMAKVIVEAGLENFDIDPSQGTHFMHNVISLNIGYFNIPYRKKGSSFIDWEWLKRQPPEISKKFVKVIKFNNPVKVIMNAKSNEFVILKPEI